MFKKFLLVFCFCTPALFAYSYTCLSPVAEKNAFAVNPVIFADDTNSGGMETFLYYGLTDNSDICSSFLTVNGYTDFSVMYRHTLGNKFTVGLKGKTFLVNPMLDFMWEDDLFIFQSSIAAQLTYDYMDAPAIYGILCPGIKLYKISEQLNICCDVNPGYYLHDGDFANLAVRSKGFALDVAPSIGFEVGNCLFNVAVPIYNVTQDMAVTFGAWFYYAIKLYKN